MPVPLACRYRRIARPEDNRPDRQSCARSPNCARPSPRSVRRRLGAARPANADAELIHSGCRLIQKQDLGLTQQDAGDCEQATLPARQPLPGGARHSTSSSIAPQPHQSRPQPGRTRRLLNRGVTRIGARELEIGPYRIADEQRRLGDRQPPSSAARRGPVTRSAVR